MARAYGQELRERVMPHSIGRHFGAAGRGPLWCWSLNRRSVGTPRPIRRSHGAPAGPAERLQARCSCGLSHGLNRGGFVEAFNGKVQAECIDQNWLSSLADTRLKREAFRRQAAFQRADHARRDARRMPVHPHDSAERLEPERMRQTAQQFIAPIMMNDRLAHDSAQTRHAVRKPFRHVPAVQRQVRTSCFSCHERKALCRLLRSVVLEPH